MNESSKVDKLEIKELKESNARYQTVIKQKKKAAELLNDKVNKLKQTNMEFEVGKELLRTEIECQAKKVSKLINQVNEKEGLWDSIQHVSKEKADTEEENKLLKQTVEKLQNEATNLSKTIEQLQNQLVILENPERYSCVSTLSVPIVDDAQIAVSNKDGTQCDHCVKLEREMDRLKRQKSALKDEKSQLELQYKQVDECYKQTIHHKDMTIREYDSILEDSEGFECKFKRLLLYHKAAQYAQIKD